MAGVSVCVPTYNAGSYLEEALSSALAQTCRDIEVLVVDNCSTDGTQAMVTELASHDARIRYVRNSTNFGMVANFNRCLELAAANTSSSSVPTTFLRQTASSACCLPFRLSRGSRWWPARAG